jgi:glycosyltransferase involved in cell wall biosynthesis
VLNIALLGTRGIPASYSGFETAAEQLAVRLVARGHRVTVYRRTHHYPGDAAAEYRGVRLVNLPTVPSKYLDTMLHSALSGLHALGQRYDAAVYFIAGNSPVCWIPRVVGTPVAINVDGLDWRRKKWPAPAKAFIKWAERMSRYTANVVVTDSRSVQDFYTETYGFTPRFIPYGADIAQLPPGDTLQKFGLEPRDYVLFVGRLVPENCIDHLVQAFRQLSTTKKCVIVGDAPYADAYKARLRELAGDDPRIVFTGYLFGEGYRELGTNSYAFIETSEVGGTHPALLEAMALGTAVVVNGTPENRETIASAGLAYDTTVGAQALVPVLRGLLSNRDERDRLAAAASARATAVYSWDAVTDQYEQLCAEMAGHR